MPIIMKLYKEQIKHEAFIVKAYFFLSAISFSVVAKPLPVLSILFSLFSRSIKSARTYKGSMAIFQKIDALQATRRIRI